MALRLYSVRQKEATNHLSLKINWISFFFFIKNQKELHIIAKIITIRSQKFDSIILRSNSYQIMSLLDNISIRSMNKHYICTCGLVNMLQVCKNETRTWVNDSIDPTETFKYYQSLKNT